MAINLGQLLQGPNSGSYTPETIDRRRQMAQAMMKGGSGIQDIRHPLQGLAQMLQAGIGGYQANRADEDEATQRSAANERIAQLLGSGMNASMGDLTSAAGDPWANDAQQQLAMMLLGEQVKKQNAPPAQPDWQTLVDNGDTFRWNAADPASTPELFFDGTDPAAEAPTVKTIFDEATGREQTVQWNGSDWEPIGGVQAPKDPLVNVNTGGNSNKFQDKADETAATRMSDLVTAGQGASQFMGDIQALAALSSQINTGKGAEILNTLGPYAQALGVEMEGLDEGQAYQAIIDRMAPAMRPAGSGAASDFDARQFLSSLPSLGRTPAGNQIIMQTLSALQQHKIAAAEIASKALNGEITWQEADREIAALGDPFSAFNEYGKQQGNAGGAAGQSTPSDIDEILKGYGL